ncbi:MAG: Activator of Hsp90 ATPase 1 family protein [Verrucomicrobiales bacterium]|nr:Activator of Hsp90 ATPase 1 family protein [Verrucomicrobiales bacterium]
MTLNLDPPSPDLLLTFCYKAEVEAVWRELATPAGVRHDWSKFCEVSEVVDGVSSFRFPGVGFFAEMRILRRDPPFLLEWECCEATHQSTGAIRELEEWTGSRIRFELSRLEEGGCRLAFTHAGLEAMECGVLCAAGWRMLLDDTLRATVEGAGAGPGLTEPGAGGGPGQWVQAA